MCTGPGRSAPRSALIRLGGGPWWDSDLQVVFVFPTISLFQFPLAALLAPCQDSFSAPSSVHLSLPLCPLPLPPTAALSPRPLHGLGTARHDQDERILPFCRVLHAMQPARPTESGIRMTVKDWGGHGRVLCGCCAGPGRCSVCPADGLSGVRAAPRAYLTLERD